jgi:ABC-type amino acid transport substrate-binding protein
LRVAIKYFPVISIGYILFEQSSGDCLLRRPGVHGQKSLGVKSAEELSGATLCTETGTTTEMNAADYFKANNIKYDIISFEKADETVSAFNKDRCDVYTTDASALYSQRLVLSDPDSSMVLPEIISKEPLGPAVRQGDDRWFSVVRWTLFCADQCGRARHHQGERDGRNGIG